MQEFWTKSLILYNCFDGKTIDDLPNELIIDILCHLRQYDIPRIKYINKRFYEIHRQWHKMIYKEINIRYPPMWRLLITSFNQLMMLDGSAQLTYSS